MGRQIQIFSTPLDAKRFQKFLEDNFQCSFYQSFSPTQEGVLLKDFNETYNNGDRILIHNRAFAWTPTYRQTRTKDRWYYIDNTSRAPILEFSKTDLKNSRHGRLYWEKYFTGVPDYDVVEFEKFYNAVVNWVRKNAKGTVKRGRDNIYYFENAWDSYRPK